MSVWFLACADGAMRGQPLMIMLMKRVTADGAMSGQPLILMLMKRVTADGAS